MRYNCCRRNVIVNAPSKSCNFQSRCGFVQLRTLTHCSCSTVNSSLPLYYFFACVLGTTIHFGSSQLHAALADMVGPIPKVRAVHYLQMCPGLLPHVASLQDSYALIMFAAICVVSTAAAAFYFLPLVAWFFSHISAETKG